MEVKILGKDIGVARGWDQTGDTEIFFYSCDTHGIYPDLEGDFVFDYMEGVFRKYDDDTGETKWEASVFDILK